MSDAWNHSERRWLLSLYSLGCAAFLLALLTPGTSATPLPRDGRPDNVDDSRDNTLFRGGDGVITVAEASSTTRHVRSDCDKGYDGGGGGGNINFYPLLPEGVSLRKVKQAGDSASHRETESLSTTVDPSSTVVRVSSGLGDRNDFVDSGRASRPGHQPQTVASPDQAPKAIAASQAPDAHQQAAQPPGVHQGKQDGADKRSDFIQTRVSRRDQLRSQVKVSHRGDHARLPRSPAKYHTTSVRPANCSVSPSCTHQDSPPSQEGGHRYPCSCDDQCHLFGDCCQESARQAPTPWQPTSLTPALISCRSLMPLAHRHDPALHRMVYMVDGCPLGTSSQLAALCGGSVPLSKREILYMIDIPVFSDRSGVVYRNIFCARCHNDAPVHELNVSITCPESRLSSPSQLSGMTYHPGELRWSKGSVAGTAPREVAESCLLNVYYPDTVGRSCEDEVVDTCSANWSAREDLRRCSSYTYYVEVGSTVYKNWDCAVCNDVPEGEIKCLSGFKAVLRTFTPPSLMNLFIVDGDCKEYQVWDALRRRCENVTCGSLFSLQDGECVRINETTTPDGRSHLNISCYTRDFIRNYSVLFPNQSIYLNYTEQIYNFGEYEFHDVWVRVCRSEDSWTPVMSILSAVLISISLLCMLLHIAIFLALPKRRNIPSMNLFSMTCSLFIAELMYMAFFRMNQNYTVCVAIAVTMYYFLSASFMWMNVMSIDICRTFLSSTYMMKSRTIFIQYSIYAWSIPTAGSLVAVIVDQVSSSEATLAPRFGMDFCWFNSKWGLVAFFTFPSGLVIMVNMMLYGVSVLNIYRQLKSGEFASSTVQRKHSSTKDKQKIGDKDGKKKSAYILGQENLSSGKISDKSESPKCTERLRDRIQRGIDARKKQRVRLVLYCKLALMMGMTWVFAFISIHTSSLIFEYLFIFFNGLQGVFILIAFDCKRKVWNELSQKIAGRTIFRNVSSRSSAKTKSWEITSEGSYRYRWSSKMRQDRSPKYSAVSQGLAEIQSPQERDESGV
ncbi:uncharacterized protein [Panulirus ornatus]|uniref:uncharacterized protein n=1 Tax=Panulirus ornatus TaxID=150431 RepID=UPI003A8B6AF4